MPLLDRHHPVPGGGRVRLRLPHLGDRAELHAFLSRLGLTVHDLDVRRGLRFAPQAGRWSIVATRWTGMREEIVGVAVVEGDDGTPTLLAEDPTVCDLLAQALAERAETTRRRVA